MKIACQIGLIVLLKTITYGSTFMTIAFPKYAIVFGSIAALSGFCFYVFCGNLVQTFLASKTAKWKKSLQRDCQIGNMDDDGNPIIIPTYWP